NNIVILTEAGIFIFQLINDENLVSLSYYHMLTNIYENIGDYDGDKLIRGWVSYVQENKQKFLEHLPHLLKFTADAELTDEIYNYVKLNREDILKYGSTILKKAIKLQASNLIEKIYNECLDLFKKDLENNNAFLSIINKSMPSLDKHYPEYIARYSSDTNMIIDSPKYKIELLNTTHLYPFSNIGIVNLTPSIVWTKYTAQEEYSWWELIKPKPSPFVKTINREIYKTWNGEALINFKWNLYGSYYYYGIWLLFTALLACFTAASTYSEDIVSEGIRNPLLKATIVLGIIHLNFELRQIYYDPIKWFIDPWNYFDFGAYLVPTIASFYWLLTKDKPHFWLSISCLLLDFKFLLFFRAFELFGVYFVIVVSVAKKIASFLVILFIVLLSFAHAFWILLKPRKDYDLNTPPPEGNDDPNNPWELTDKYTQILDDGTNETYVQQPDKNTNMFTTYRTSLLSMYLYLTGDPNALPNWEYLDNPKLTILMVLFSLLIAVYLMNLLIGLLSNAIDEDNNRASYFMQKARILEEIELFYLFPNQRRWKTWFPDVIYYHANVEETRKEIQKLIQNESHTEKFSDMKEELRKI
ncbi:8182_t:CDS:2, partial [Funneliformis caledonium]